MLLDDAPLQHTPGAWAPSPGGGDSVLEPPPRRKLVERRPEQTFLSDAYRALWGAKWGASLSADDETYPVGALGKGLNNPTGMNNCFLNVIIQSLFHIEGFR